MTRIVGYSFPHTAKKRDVRSSGQRGLTPLEVPMVPVLSLPTIAFRVVAGLPIAFVSLMIGLGPFVTRLSGAKDGVAAVFSFPIAWAFVLAYVWFVAASFRQRRDALLINAQTIEQLAKPGEKAPRRRVMGRGRMAWIGTGVGLAGLVFLELAIPHLNHRFAVFVLWGVLFSCAFTLMGPTFLISQAVRSVSFFRQRQTLKRIEKDDQNDDVISVTDTSAPDALVREGSGQNNIADLPVSR